MLKLSLCSCVVLFALGIACAEELQLPSTTPESSVAYVVHLTEYHLNRPLDPAQSAEEILALVSAQGGETKATLVETIRLSTLSGTESVASFGRRFYVTAAAGPDVRGNTIRTSQSVETGTLIKVLLEPHKGKVALMLTYETTRHGDDSDDDSPPGPNKAQVKITRINTNLTLEPGKPALVGSSTTSSSSIVVVRVTSN